VLEIIEKESLSVVSKWMEYRKRASICLSDHARSASTQFRLRPLNKPENRLVGFVQIIEPPPDIFAPDTTDRAFITQPI